MKKFDIDSQVVIMCGISGSGKTFYARQLEKEGYLRLSSDELIWEKVGKGLFDLSKDKQRLIFLESRKVILEKLTTILKSGQKVVMDATNCKREVRDEIRNLCAQVNKKPQFVYCRADKEQLWQRLSQRKGTGPDDLYVSKDQLSEYWEGFEHPQDDESDFIII